MRKGDWHTDQIARFALRDDRVLLIGCATGNGLLDHPEANYVIELWWEIGRRLRSGGVGLPRLGVRQRRIEFAPFAAVGILHPDMLLPFEIGQGQRGSVRQGDAL